MGQNGSKRVKKGQNTIYIMFRYYQDAKYIRFFLVVFYKRILSFLILFENLSKT